MELPNFEADATPAILDQMEEHARQHIAPAVQAHAHGILRAYGRENGYNVGSLIDAGEISVERQAGGVVVRWGWPEPAIYLERGTVDHGPRTADVLSWVWENPPAWVREEFEREGDGYRVFLPEVSGLPESRFIRDTLNWLRGEFA
jgi:hypothetical protein